MLNFNLLAPVQLVGRLNLNTSHVKLQQFPFGNTISVFSNLNTSHVKLQQEQIDNAIIE